MTIQVQQSWEAAEHGLQSETQAPKFGGVTLHSRFKQATSGLFASLLSGGGDSPPRVKTNVDIRIRSKIISNGSRSTGASRAEGCGRRRQVEVAGKVLRPHLGACDSRTGSPWAWSCRPRAGGAAQRTLLRPVSF